MRAPIVLLLALGVVTPAMPVFADGAPQAAAPDPALTAPAGTAQAQAAAVASGLDARPLPAKGRVRICYNYGCAREDDVEVGGPVLASIRQRLAAAADAAAERAVLSDAVGRLYRVAAAQTPVGADREGNFLDQGVEGRMDCIDHSTSTTRLLRLIEARGWLRFHRVEAPARRERFIFQHFGAVVAEVAPAAPVVEAAVPDHVPALLVLCDCPEVVADIPRAADGGMAAGAPGERFVVDSWFVDNGEAAIVLPLAEWLKGEGPNVQ